MASQVNKEIMERRKSLQHNIWRNINLKKSMLKQKSRLKWIKEVDCNSKYFHFVVRARSRRNALVSLQTEQGVLKEVGDVKRG